MKKDKIDSPELLKVREQALYKVKNTMPERGELPDEHIARCWYESFIEMGVLVSSAEVRNSRDNIIQLGKRVVSFNQAVKDLKENKEILALEYSRDLSNRGHSAPRDAINPGGYFGFIEGVEAAIEILEKK